MGSNGEIPVFLIGSTAIFCSGINEKYSQVCPVFPFRYTACFFRGASSPLLPRLLRGRFVRCASRPRDNTVCPISRARFAPRFFSGRSDFFPGRCRAVFFPGAKCSVLPRYLMADGENTSKGNYRQSDRVFF